MSRRRVSRRDLSMSLGEHLTEARKRLIRAVAALLAGTVAGWLLSDLALAEIRNPILQIAAVQGRAAQLNFDSVTSAFDLKVQIAITLGIVLSSPVWLYQLWAFFVPALNRRELRYSLGFFFSAVPLFLAGCLSGWFVVPHIVVLLGSFGSSQDGAFIEASAYYSFVLKLVLAVGVAFVLPVLLVLLNFVGVLEGRSILRSWRLATVTIVVFTAIATPSADVVAMFVLAGPLVALYFAAAGIAIFHDSRRRRAAERIGNAARQPGVTNVGS